MVVSGPRLWKGLETMKVINRPTWELRIFFTPIWFDWWRSGNNVWLLILFRIGIRLDKYPRLYS